MGDAQNFFVPGQASSFDGVANIDSTVGGIEVWGWIGFIAAEGNSFGYVINDTVVVDPNFAQDAEAPVVAAATAQGAQSANRMKVIIPTADLAAGEYNVAVYAIDANNNVELIVSFKIVKA